MVSQWGTSFSLQMAAFNSMAQQVKLVTQNMEFGQLSVRVLQFLPANHHNTHSSIIISVKAGPVQLL
jgi:hypothetical protein